MLAASMVGLIGSLWYWGVNFQNLLTLVRMPFFGDADEVMYMVTARSFMVGAKLTDSIYAFPGVQDLNFAFFSVDSLAPAVAGFFARIFNDLIVGVNVYYFLSFAATGALAYIACRILGIDRSASILGSIAINFLPMHLTGGTQSLTLTSIYLIAPVAAICIRQLGANPILYLSSLREKNSPSKFRQILIMGLLTLFGASYSYHTAMILFIFGTLYIFMLLSGRLRHKLALPTALSFISLGFLMAAIPALLSAFSASGKNYLGGRSWIASLHLTGYPSQFLIPYTNTMVDRISASLLSWYPPKIAALRILPSQGYFGEGEIYAVSLFLVLPAIVIYFVLKTKESRRIFKLQESNKISKRENQPRFQDVFVIFLAIFITFLWSIVGGFGVMFSLFISAILRGYSRFMVLVPILIVFIIGLYLTELRERSSLFTQGKWIHKKSHRGSHIAMFVLSLSLLLSGVDALVVNMGRDRTVRAPTAISQRASMGILYNQLETLKPGCGILELPIVHYPYEQPGYELYRELVPGLYSQKF